jgi:hypothetical protein
MVLSRRCERGSADATTRSWALTEHGTTKRGSKSKEGWDQAMRPARPRARRPAWAKSWRHRRRGHLGSDGDADMSTAAMRSMKWRGVWPGEEADARRDEIGRGGRRWGLCGVRRRITDQLSQNRPIYTRSSMTVPAYTLTRTHLSSYKPGSPSNITKDLESSPNTTKIVHDSTYMSHDTTSSQIVHIHRSST